MRLTDPIIIGADYSEEDIFDIAKLIESTVTSSKLRQLIYGNIPLNELEKYFVEDVRYGLQQEFSMPSISEDDNLDIERREHLIVRDLDLPPTLQELTGNPYKTHLGRIVAHVEFRYLPTDWIKTFDGSGNHPTSTQSLPPPMPDAANKGLINYFRSAGLPFVKQLYGGKRRFLVKDICTLPSHSRKGIASKLLSWIFPISAKDNVPVVLAATSMGLSLYRKLGFQEVSGPLGVLQIDRGAWGGEGVNQHAFMIRLPNDAGLRGQTTVEVSNSGN
jgi:GNAT superfamily N-acetyltransferase